MSVQMSEIFTGTQSRYGWFANRNHQDSSRITGLDLARGIAVLGMVAAHLYAGALIPRWSVPDTWLGLVNGRSAILFAILAGVSLALLSGQTEPPTGHVLVRARTRILVRAVLIYLIGGLLTLFVTPLAIILPTYAALFVIVLPVLRWSARSLFIFAAILAMIMPLIVQLLITALPQFQLVNIHFFDLMVSGPYPVLLWCVFILVGLGIGRLDLTNHSVQLSVLGVGVCLVIVGYGLGALSESLIGAPTSVFDSSLSTESISDVSATPGSIVERLAGSRPHSGSTCEIIGSTGFAISIIALCLLCASRLRVFLFPLAAVGSMALTVYICHVLEYFILDKIGWVDADSAAMNCALSASVILIFCSAWAPLMGRGPAERLLSYVSNRASSIDST
ncbi:MAG: heparan-alpha-glucosaminide N-acetyltransferase domain-containing protein [Mycobacteriaceae bacterium]